jgi:hypothetical protein
LCGQLLKVLWQLLPLSELFLLRQLFIKKNKGEEVEKNNFTDFNKLAEEVMNAPEKRLDNANSMTVPANNVTEIMYQSKDVQELKERATTKVRELQAKISDLEQNNAKLSEKGRELLIKNKELKKRSILETNLVSALELMGIVGFFEHEVNITGDDANLNWVSKVLATLDLKIAEHKNSIVGANLLAVSRTVRYLATFDKEIAPSVALTLFNYIRDFECCPFRKQIYLINTKPEEPYTASNSFPYLNYFFKIAFSLKTGHLTKPIQQPSINFVKIGEKSPQDECTVTMHIKGHEEPFVFSRTRGEVSLSIKQQQMKNSDLMFQKTVVSQALNWAFPEIFGGTYIKEEAWFDAKDAINVTSKETIEIVNNVELEA